MIANVAVEIILINTPLVSRGQVACCCFPNKINQNQLECLENFPAAEQSDKAKQVNRPHSASTPHLVSL